MALQVRSSEAACLDPEASVTLLPGARLEPCKRKFLSLTILLSLVMGLLRPSTGTVRVDGERLTPELGHALRAWIWCVGQDTVFFNASVRENLLSAAPEAYDGAIGRALLDARADFVSQLPRGLETRVGDLGVPLSGGQRQPPGIGTGPAQEAAAADHG